MMRKLISLSVALTALSSMAFADVGQGIDKLNAGDVAGAAKDFANAYDAGDSDGAFYLGRLFELGLGTERDGMRAANLYSAAAEKGSVRAKVRLGLMYHEGTVLLRDYTEGTRLLCEAADAEDIGGQVNCGLALKSGIGVPENPDLAVEYWNKAAANNDVAALNLLGDHFLRGQTDVAKPDTAATFFKRAADLGNALGMYEFARILANPVEGQQVDKVTAYTYASLAVVRGYQSAGALRDALELDMTPEEIEAGQVGAKDWTQAQISKTDAGQ